MQPKTPQLIIDYIDEYLSASDGFLSHPALDFALDVRSFVSELDRETAFVEAA